MPKPAQAQTKTITTEALQVVESPNCSKWNTRKPPTELEQLELEFVKANMECREGIQHLLWKIWECGIILRRCKQLLPHGQFGHFCRNRIGIPERTGSRYMQSSRETQAKTAIVADLKPEEILPRLTEFRNNPEFCIQFKQAVAPRLLGETAQALGEVQQRQTKGRKLQTALEEAAGGGEIGDREYAIVFANQLTDKLNSLHDFVEHLPDDDNFVSLTSSLTRALRNLGITPERYAQILEQEGAPS